MKSYKLTVSLFLALPLLWVGARVLLNSEAKGIEEFSPKYEVEYDFTVRNDRDYWVKTFIPRSDERQEIIVPLDQPDHEVIYEEGNTLARWSGNSQGLNHIKFAFSFKGKRVNYHISDQIFYEPQIGLENSDFLSATEYIQSESPSIGQLSTELKADHKSLNKVLRAFYNYTFELPTSGTNELTDALTALENQEASCNGKSRLLIALCRSQQIPARMVGGIILESSEKKTSHAWVEININDTWVPFDPLNGHYASLPANYLKVYTGDNFLITRSPGVTFDYQYKIKEQRAGAFSKWSLINLWELSEEGLIPLNMIRIILLLPLGAMLIGILKNVIGLKTIGIFLPVLIAISFVQTGLMTGALLFTLVVFVVASLNLPLTQWGIQHTAKLTLMMTVVVLITLGIVLALSQGNVLPAATPLFFPFIIMTIVSEKLARTIDEDGMKVALDMYFQTFIVTLVLYFVLSSELIQNFLITFPEIILSFIGINLMLGKWIGLRVLEYKRFLNVIKA